MEQNINLITTINLQTTSFFNARLILQITVGWIILLILIYLIALGTYKYKQTAIADLATTHKNLQEQISILTQKLAITNWSETTTDIKNIPLELINTHGFYRYLEDLAKFTPPNIWLNYIVFAKTGNSIIFQGTATDATDIPSLIEAIDEAPTFNGKKFGVLQLQKVTDSENINFILGTEQMKATYEPAINKIPTNIK